MNNNQPNKLHLYDLEKLEREREERRQSDYAWFESKYKWILLAAVVVFLAAIILMLLHLHLSPVGAWVAIVALGGGLVFAQSYHSKIMRKVDDKPEEKDEKK